MTELNFNSLIENIITLQPLLYKNLAKPTRSKTPISPGSMFVLGIINRYGIISMSDIGRRLSMPKPHVTGLVDKLIAEELVERLNDPNDRRIVNISLTPKGIETYIALKKEISEDLKTKLLLLDEKTLETLATASKQVKDILLQLGELDCRLKHEAIQQ